MAVRMKRPGKRVLALLGILAVLAAGCIGFTGCQGGSGDTEKIRDLEFTGTGEGFGILSRRIPFSADAFSVTEECGIFFEKLV